MQIPRMSESDEPELSSHALHGLLSDLNTSSSSRKNSLPQAQLPTWSFPPTITRDSPSPRLSENSATATIFSRRSTPRVDPNPAPELDLAAPNAAAQQSSLFNTPSRSIFSSGPPTSSVSANTAHASMSSPPPVSSSRPLSALTGPSVSTPRRSVHYLSDGPSSMRNGRTPRAEKDTDDPSICGARSRSAEKRGTSTPTALTRLFTAPEAATPTISRHASCIRTTSGTPYIRASTTDTAPLPNHLYTRGLLGGKHSDITVIAFGHRYPLHRLLLDRAPFFASALSEPWFESTSKDIVLHPEDIDSNISQAAFELAVKRLYGCESRIEEDKEAIGLFATGCWLEMADLIDSSVTSILRQMTPGRLASLIRLVTSNYYGKPGDRILESAKAMLCREGWEMPLKYWDGISGEIAREIIGGDGFYVSGEWDRWVLAKRILDRKLKLKAIEAGLFDANGKYKRAPPDTMGFLAIRFDTVYRKDAMTACKNLPETYNAWLALYTHPDIAALLVLLDEGIHYVHLSFEQLQKIRDQRDVLGLPVMPERVITNALWMSMELRQKVLNAHEVDMELGLTQVSEELFNDGPSDEGNLIKSSPSLDAASMTSKGKQPETSSHDGEADDIESGSWDGNGKPRKFWIPHTDSTSVMGGNPDSLMHGSNGTRPYLTRHLSRFSASIDPVDVQWASDFTAAANERPHTPGRSTTSEPVTPISYTHYPPFRFSAEFPNPKNLREKKRVYSKTVWYAGSLWNVYIQKVETTKNMQLGVYLHRAKEKDNPEDIRGGSVDERIGQMEMLMRRNGHHRRHQHRRISRGDGDDSSGSGGDADTTLVPSLAESTSRANAISSLLQGNSIMKASQTPGILTLSSLPDRSYNPSLIGSDDEANDDLEKASKRFNRMPTMPPYVDDRPTIKTYFKIYSPSKGGRMLSVYESAPDHFNFSQSWGWKSSTMILDDAQLGYEDESAARRGDGKLRFMVRLSLFLLG
ncbi:MAG: hypothetical protein L6R41_007569 [Letrouitia leprolyta]|nr:MAG: hypothetical protein L6R41_007569 [Letrouitia leprolyta]